MTRPSVVVIAVEKRYSLMPVSWARWKPWRGDGEVSDAYEDVAGFCYNVKLEEIEKNGYVLTPGCYVGAADQDVDDEPFDQKMKRLAALLKQQQEEGAKLDATITRHLALLGFGDE